jgi:hypothetical protein
MKDLFGNEISEVETVKKGYYAERKRQLEYKRSFNKNMCCKVCKYCICNIRAKRYYKCELIGLSMSSATDIKVNFVCKKFVRKENEKV